MHAIVVILVVVGLVIALWGLIAMGDEQDKRNHMPRYRRKFAPSNMLFHLFLVVTGFSLTILGVIIALIKGF